MIKKGSLVHITWHDAEVTSEWKKEDDLTDHSSTLCETVGYVVKRPTKKSPIYITASTRSKDDDGHYEYNAIYKIPVAWVKEVKEI